MMEAATAGTVAKLVLVGDGGVGKTTFVQRHRTGEFERRNIPTMGVCVSQLTCETTQGRLTYNIWDVAGQDGYGGLREGYYLEAQCAIIFFDVTWAATYHNVAAWHSDLILNCPGIPIVLVGNKIDAPNCRVRANRVTFHNEHNMPYFEMSTKSNYNIEMPFLSIARQLTGDPNLAFTAPPVKVQYGVPPDPALVKQYEVGPPLAQPEDGDEDFFA
jgi:GTP-binding nuclear protein Ran